jgi:hypothetical protein
MIRSNELTLTLLITYNSLYQIVTQKTKTKLLKNNFYDGMDKVKGR